MGTRARNPLRTVCARSVSSYIQAVSGERKTVGPESVDGDAGLTPFAAQGLGDAVDGGLGGAIGGVAGGMAEQPARRRGEDHLAAAALFEHLLAGGARHDPGLVDVGVHDLEEILDLLVDDLGHFVEPAGHHQDVEAAEFVDGERDDLIAVFFRRGAQRDAGRLGAELLAFGRDLLQLRVLARGQHHIGAGAGQGLGRQRAESAGGAGHDRGLALDVEQGDGIFQEVFGHHALPILFGVMPAKAGIQSSPNARR